MPNRLGNILFLILLLTSFGLSSFLYLKCSRLNKGCPICGSGEDGGTSVFSDTSKYSVDYDFLGQFEKMESNYLRADFELSDSTKDNITAGYFSMKFEENTALICTPKSIEGSKVPSYRYSDYDILSQKDYVQKIDEGLKIPFNKRLEILKKYKQFEPLKLGIKELPDKALKLVYIEVFLEDISVCR